MQRADARYGGYNFFTMSISRPGLLLLVDVDDAIRGTARHDARGEPPKIIIVSNHALHPGWWIRNTPETKEPETRIGRQSRTEPLGARSPTITRTRSYVDMP